MLKAFQRSEFKANLKLSESKGFIPDLPSYISAQPNRVKSTVKAAELSVSPPAADLAAKNVLKPQAASL